MGACLSKGHEAGATAPVQTAAATQISPAQENSKPQKGSPPQSNSLHVEDANNTAAAPPEEKHIHANNNGPQQNSSHQASSTEGTPVATKSLEPALPPLKTSPFATNSSTPVQTPVQKLEPSPPRESSSSSDQEEAQNGWSSNLQADLCSGDCYTAVYPMDAGAERKRVHALKRLGINYTSNEPSLDFITKLVTNVCGVASAVVTFIDQDHCYIKSSTGIPTDTKQLSRSISMCSWVLAPLHPEVLVVEDLTRDDRFKSHPFVMKRPYLRFLAAAPLLDASGQRVGALTVHDFKPKKFDAEQCNVLCNFAEMTVREIQRITESSMQRSMSLNLENEQLLRSIDDCSDGVVLLDVRIPRWPVLFSNEGWSQLTGQEPVSGSLKCFWDIFRAPGASASRTPWQVYDGTIERGETFQLDVILAGSSGKQLFPITFKPATETLDEGMVNINVPAQAATAIPTSRENKLFYFGTIVRKPKQDALTPTLGQRNSFAAADDDLKPPITGVRLGPLLGKGSFGSVHYGTWNGAQIAVKVIQHMATEAERQARDEQLEAILGLKMLHPNIVRTFQFATKDRTQSRPASLSERMRLELNGNLDEEDSPKTRGQRRMMETWIVLELCNRGSLQDAIDKGAFKTRGTIHEGSPNMVNILRTATEIAGAMTYLHSLDILHSDLNGNNILLISNTGIDDRPFSVKVSDFGLSRIHIGERTIATQTYGTVTHMPPELLSEGRLSKAADVYAFGVLLWEMLTGQRPWAGLRHVQIITHKMRNGTQLKWPSDVHPDFKRLAQHCMTPDPHQRPSFAEVLDFLEPLRDLAERGELPTTATYAPPERTEIGALLGSVKEIEEEGEEGRGSK